MGRVIAAFTQFFDDAGDPLVNGWLEFLESNTTSTKKNTYADYNYQTLNANPVQLDGAGRCPNVFGTGTYRVISYTRNIDDEAEVGDQIQMFDPVTAEGTASGSSDAVFSTWDSTVTYAVGDIVTASGNYYRSLVGSNLNNNPTVSPSLWEEIAFLETYNANVTYNLGDPAYYSGAIWFSLQNANTGNTPDSSPTYWNKGPTLGGETIGSAASPVDTLFVDNIGTLAQPCDKLYVNYAFVNDVIFDGVAPSFVHFYYSDGIQKLYLVNLLGDISIDATGDIIMSGNLIPNGVIYVGTESDPFDYGFFEQIGSALLRTNDIYATIVNSLNFRSPDIMYFFPNYFRV